jgi:hypothetical protein
MQLIRKRVKSYDFSYLDDYLEKLHRDLILEGILATGMTLFSIIMGILQPWTLVITVPISLVTWSVFAVFLQILLKN